MNYLPLSRPAPSDPVLVRRLALSVLFRALRDCCGVIESGVRREDWPRLKAEAQAFLFGHLDSPGEAPAAGLTLWCDLAQVPVDRLVTAFLGLERRALASDQPARFLDQYDPGTDGRTDLTCRWSPVESPVADPLGRPPVGSQPGSQGRNPVERGNA